MYKDLMSVTEVAELLSLHVKTVRNHVREGKLKSTRVGKQYRIRRVDLDAFVGTATASLAQVQGPVATSASSVVEIDGINPVKAQRLSNTVMAAVKGRNKDDQALKIETLYFEDRARLKVVILGSLETTGALLGMIAHLAQAENAGNS